MSEAEKIFQETMLQTGDYYWNRLKFLEAHNAYILSNMTSDEFYAKATGIAQLFFVCNEYWPRIEAIKRADRHTPTDEAKRLSEQRMDLEKEFTEKICELLGIQPESQVNSMPYEPESENMNLANVVKLYATAAKAREH